MSEDKVKFLKEAKLVKKAKDIFENELKYQNNPIKAKFSAFKKAKKDITPKDLF